MSRVSQLSWLVLVLALIVYFTSRQLPALPEYGKVPLLLPLPIWSVGNFLVSSLHTLILALTPPPLSLYWHVSSFVLTGALRAAVKLEIAEKLEHGPLSLTMLANVTNSQPKLLRRLLVALETLHTFKENEDGSWENTPISEYLQADHPQSMRDFILMMSTEQYIAFSKLDRAISHGDSAFALVYNQQFWQYLDNNPGALHTFDAGQHALSSLADRAIVEDGNFATSKHICDIAGGIGGFIHALLVTYPHIEATLFDRAPVIEEARRKWTTSPDFAKHLERTSFVAGDFFLVETLPKHCDLYVFKQVLHQHDDDLIITILRNVHQLMRQRALLTGLQKNPKPKIAIIERLLPAKKESFVHSKGVAFLDLLMLSNFNGKEREEAEWKHLLNMTGFQVERVLKTRSDFVVIEAVAVDEVATVIP